MNRRLFGSVILIAAFAGLSGTDALGQKKDKKKDDTKKEEPPVDSAKLKPGEFFGVLKTTPGSDRMFTIEVETTKVVPSSKGGGKGGGGNTNMQNVLRIQTQLQQAQAQQASARTPQARQQAGNRVRQLSSQLQTAIGRLQGGGAGGSLPAGYKYEKSKTMVEFQASETMKVRTMVQPEVFDDKGNIIKPDSKKLAEWKGKDKSLPGFESSLEKLEVGQKIRVSLAMASSKPPAKDSAKTKDDDDEMKADKAKQARMIVVLADAERPASKDRPKKKK